MAEPRLIYRLENDAGEGPWAAGTGFWADLDRNYEGDEYPTPLEDPGLGAKATADLRKRGLMRGDLWPLGCSSEGQLRYWFDEEVCSYLEGFGFSYTVWRCPPDRCVAGEFQVIFDREHSECAERHPASALWAPSPQLSLPLAA